MKRMLFIALNTLPYFVVAGLASDTEMTTYVSRFRGNAVHIDGTSTMHDWRVTGTLIAGSIQLPTNWQAFQFTTNAPIAASVAVSIPVKSLKSQVAVGSDTMDNVMGSAMKADLHSNIVFRLERLVAKDANHAFMATGTLVVAGVTNHIEFPVSIRATNSLLHVSGRVPLKMTDFGIIPPKPKFMPLLKVGDAVTITFDWRPHRESRPPRSAGIN